MKKLLCLVLALLCVATAAMASSVPSKSTADMVTVQVQGDNIPASFTVAPVVDGAQVEACQAEIAKLAASASVEDYFGQVTDAFGNTVSLSALLGTSSLSVNEFMPIAMPEYDASYGAVKVTFQFSTPYAAGEEVLALIGIEDVFGDVAWTALDGVGTGVNGGVEIDFTSDVLLAMQGSDCLMAIVSK